MKCVDYLNKYHFNNYFPEWKIWRMVTANAAVGLAVGDQIGFLKPTYVADVVIFNSSSASNYYRAAIEADWKDIVLVLRSGIPLYGDRELMTIIPNGQSGCEDIIVKGCSDNKINKTGCTKRETGHSFKDLVDANKDSYPLYYCRTPFNEPSCFPTRPQ